MSVEPNPSAPVFLPSDFIRDIVAVDVAARRYPKIVTRFPPEPNGYLHIGHAKSICLNFGIARENNGQCNLRLDDTNPAKEGAEYVESITTDVRWLISGWADKYLGFKPKGTTPVARTINGKVDYYLTPAAPSLNSEPFFASDYFGPIYEFALQLIKKDKAYVCDLNTEEADKYRGAPNQPGKDSPYRNRSIEENLDLFQRMRAGEFHDGARTLRAKIDMTAPNFWLRDPLLYRIRHVPHHHTGDKWCIYPLYDFAHCLSDYLEGITHSLCTLEFSDHRALYDWVLESLGLPRPLPHQYEFAKLIPGYMTVSKRELLQLVNKKIVTGWDDPSMPTLSGLRRRGVPAAAVRQFVYNTGVTKYDSTTDIAVFEHAARDVLNKTAIRRFAVLRPIKVTLTNLEYGEVIFCNAVNNPQGETPTTRKVSLTREIYIESDDFAENPPPKYFRLRPGGEVRLKYACIVKCDEVIKDVSGQITEIRCTANLSTRAGQPNAGRKVKGTIHWVSAAKSLDAEVRLYDRLLSVVNSNFTQNVNSKLFEAISAKVEPYLKVATADQHFQFERLGYFILDAKEATPVKLVFNRTITLKDTWAK